MLSLDRQNELRESYRRSHPGWRPATEIYRALVEKKLRPGWRLLDLGCGRGGLVEQLDHPLENVLGVDPDLSSLLGHRLRSQGVGLVNGVSAALPLRSGSVDLVIASWVLEHTPRPGADFRHIGRVLRPGGLFIFITPNRRHPLSALNRMAGRMGAVQGRFVRRLYGRAAEDAFPAFYRANDEAALRRLGRAGGLRLSHLETVADPTYLAFRPAFFRLAAWIEDRLPAERGIHLVGEFERQ